MCSSHCRALRPSEISSYWYARAWDWITENPVQWLELEGEKLRLLLNWFEIPNSHSYYTARESSW